MPRRAALLVLLYACAVGAAGADPGVTDSTVTIGQTVGLTGPAAPAAREIAVGLGAAVAAINKRGGVNGRKLVLETMDDGFAPPRAAENTKALAEKAFLLAAPLGTPHTLEGLKITSAARVPLMCPFTGAEALRAKHDRYLFHLRAGYRDEVRKMIEQLTTVGITRVALFYQNDAFGQEGLTHVQAALQARSLKLAAAAPIERGSVDVAPAVKTFVAAQPQAIIMFATINPSAELVKQMYRAGSAPQYLTLSLNSSDDFAQALGERKRGVIVSTVVPSPWLNISPVVKEYQEAMREAGRTTLSLNSFEAFLCGKVIAEGLRRVPRNQLSRERFVQALEGLKGYALSELEVSYSPTDRLGSTYVDLMVIDSRGRFQH